MEEHFRNSSLRESLIEHLFIGELLKCSWLIGDFNFEVSKPEVDNSGYDIVLEAQGVIRHVQLKAAFVGAKTARQNVHIDLMKKPSGCVIWVYINSGTLELGPYLFFGGNPGEPLPDISSYPIAKHTKGDAAGIKAERPNIHVVNKGHFITYRSIPELYNALFGLGE
jgi:hypothetical protein